MIPIQSELNHKLALEFSKTLQLFHLSSLDARLYVYLFLANKPKTLDEMSDALDKSKTTMSTSARNLHEKNLITLVWRKGVRKDLYEANRDLFKVFMEVQLKKWNTSIEFQKNIIQHIYEEVVSKDDSPADHQFKEQIIDILQFHEEVNTFINQKLNNQ